jgi:cyclopropane-fatty-acyl-phospholipid synthase
LSHRNAEALRLASVFRPFYSERAMNPLATVVQSRIAEAPALAVQLPGGRWLGAADARVRMALKGWTPLAHLARGQIGRLADDHVQGRVDLTGSMRDIMETAAALLDADPTQPRSAPRRARWWHEWRSHWRHTPAADARQVQFHYDVCDDFYALWLDPRRVYSCAYWPAGVDDVATAQQAKLDLVCRKLMLRPGERFLDVGAGWGGLLLWAAEHYGVHGHGITLSRHQHAHVERLIAERGLQGRVRMQLLDYRDLPEDEPFDKIASIGMFEHVGRARLPGYFAKLRHLLAPGGLLMNHGITAGGTRNRELGAGIGSFIERHIFPGGELLHVSHVLEAMADAGWEMLDVENLRPHYARTLWAWSDMLEAQLEPARALTSEAVLRAWRLYLAGSAIAFERGWMSLHQILAARPTGRVDDPRGPGLPAGAQSVYPFTRDHVYAAPAGAAQPGTDDTD